MNQRGGFTGLLVVAALAVLAAVAGWYWWNFYFSRGVADPISNGVLFESSPSCKGLCHFRRGEVKVAFWSRITREQAEETVNRLNYRVKEDLWDQHSLVVAVPMFGEPRAIQVFDAEEETVQSADYHYLEAAPASDAAF
ncbi:MAG: hypothetical protein HY473_01905 [Candidatus Sungbacteria bacterium]|uniref:Uncharacterized protein n=1 Tax=Candidatus Sungiibacteriota bacterium TaxID=2750080 RepID=A0A933DS45_9BACT|nr:hypothetical protein [Candidatus Sungbacteria bacterium]